ncbi:MAG: NADH-quinone oxidoreductase subunit NuoK [Cytophagaceae bacterium]
MIPLEHFLVISAILFCTGVAIVLSRKNAIVILMGVELLLNAANINLAAFSYFDPAFSGQLFVLFVFVIAVAEAGVALAIIFQVYKYFYTSEADEVKTLSEQ